MLACGLNGTSAWWLPLLAGSVAGGARSASQACDDRSAVVELALHALQGTQQERRHANCAGTAETDVKHLVAQALI